MKFTEKTGQNFGKSRNGLTSGETANGKYLRARAVPRNRQTGKLSDVRSTFGTTVTNWHDVGAGDRIEWREGIPTTGPGTAKFTGTNVNRQTVGQPILIETPVFVFPPDFMYTVQMFDRLGIDDSIDIVLSAGDYTGITMYVRVLGNIPPWTTDVPLSDLPPLVSIFEPPIGPISVLAAYEAVYGSIVGKQDTPEGGAAWAIRLGHVPSGQFTPWQRSFATVIED